MNFFAILKSLDELLYEIMSWLIFYPITLWRALRAPLVMMDYADTELEDAEAEQYTDTLSPPLFLLLSLILSHALELALVGQSAIVSDNKGLAAFVTDDTSLIMLRIVLFSLFPLILAMRLIRLQKKKLERKTLQAPFYSQCYVAAPFALLTGVAALMMSSDKPHVLLGGVVAEAMILLWYGIVQTLWFSRQLHIGKARAFGHASRAMAEGGIAILLMALLFA